jgi:hypothetical protein
MNPTLNLFYDGALELDQAPTIIATRPECQEQAVKPENMSWSKQLTTYTTSASPIAMRGSMHCPLT